MAKQLNVNLAFSADTSKVKTQLQDLQNQLNKLTLSSKTELGITKDIEDASRAAAELSVHLKNATNQQTGTLDFSKLNQSIKQSGTSLQQYGRTLQSLGPQGQQAFMSLAQAVANSEVPIRRTNTMLKEMGTVLANTARWQLSSSMLHGFMGAVQSAYGYAQDLNESLNNIRIVTGQNIDQMAKFAEKANKAARALSTTTTEYTNASLIYYQQGLNDQQVKERTDITIKMANVARQSAEVVSDQMTAVWNNFYDGSKSLEHYADVMTALGAATASSTDEIAEGLNKFAAVADTVGLSYEYAASALATVTATTRQSADVVGTAFKTLFARIQDLELGKTLDDGTTLGSYSQALAKVGVQIKDTSGEMKSMDTILEEMAAKWDTLGKAEQIALAQSVAGVRQYTQLIALMDNWDFMEKNLATSNTSSGALQKQADIYAESWEAARDRVTAAAESVYKALINDEFFIDLLNGVEKVIGFVDHLIDNLGGLKGVLTALGAIVTRVFSNQIAQGFTNIAYNLRMMTEKGRQAERDARKKVIDDAVQNVTSNKEYTTDVEKAQQQGMRSQLELQQQYMENVDRMNGVEAEVNKKLMDRVSILRQAAVEAEKRKEAAEKNIDDASYGIMTDISSYNTTQAEKDPDYIPVSYNQVYEKSIKPMKELAQFQVQIEAGAKNTYNAIRSGSDSAEKAIIELNQQVQASSEISEEVKQIFASLNKTSTVDEVEAAVRALNQELSKAIGEHSGEVKNVVGPDAAKKVDQYVTAVREKTRAELDSADATRQARAAHDKASDSIMTATGKQKQWSDILVESANFAFSAATALSMLGSAFETIMDPDVSGWQKFLTVLTTLGMVVPTLVNLFSTFKSLLSAENIAKLANVAATVAQVAAEKALNKEKGVSKITTKKSIKETWEDTKTKLKNTGGKIKGKFGEWKNNFNTAAWHKQQGMTQGPGSLEQTQAAGKAAGKTLGKLAGGVALIAAGVTVAVKAVQWGIAQYNKQAEAAKKAAEMSKEAASAYDSVAEANNKFTDSVSAYESAQQSLEGMTKGTADYEAAVLKANDAAIALLDTYKDLTYTVDGNGLILIDEASLEQAKKSQLDILQNAQMSKQIAAQNVRDKELAAEMTQFERDKLHSSEGFLFGAGNAAVATGVGTGSGALIGTGLGTVIGTVLPGLGNIIGAGVGATVGAIAGAIVGVIGSATAGAAAGEEERALQALAEEYANSGSAAFASDEALRDLLKNKLKIDDEALINSLVANRESTLELAQAMAANTAQIEAQNIALVQQELGDVIKNSNLSQENQQNLTEVMGRSLDHLADDLYEEIYKDQAGGLTDKEIQKQYAEAMGWDVEKTENKNGNKATYYDKDGNVVAEDLSDEIARRYLAQAKALQNLETSSKKLIDTFNRLDQSLNNYDHAFRDFLGDKNFMESGYDEVNALIQEVGGVITKDTVARYLDEQLGDGKDGKISDETANAWGYANAEAFYNSFYTALISYNDKWEDIASGVTNYAEDIFNNFSDEIKGAMSQKQASAFVNDINQARLKHGTEGADIITSLYQKAGKEAGKLAEALDGVDWDTISIQELADTINAAGITTNYAATELGTFIDMMEDSSNSITNLQELAKLTKELSTLQQGDTIDVEQFNQLSTEMQSYFTLMSDGTYKLTKDALDFYQLTQNFYKIQAEYAIRKLTAEQENIVRLYNMKEDKGAKYFTQDYIEPEAHSESRYLLDASVAWGMYGDWGLGYTGKTYEEYVQMYGPSGAKVTNGKADMTGVSNIHDDRGMGQDGKYTILIKPEVDDSDPTAPIDGPTDYIFYGSEDAWRKNLLVPAGSDSYDTYNNNKQLIQDQIDILKYSEWGKTTEGQSQLIDWQDAFDKGLFSDEMAYYLAEKVDTNINSAFDNLGTSMTGINTALQEAMDSRAMAATSYKEREELLELGPANGGINLEAYNKAAEAAINQERLEDLDVAQVAEYAEYLEDAFDMSEEGAEEAARVIMKMNKGIESLSNGFEDWSDILEKSSEDSYEYFEAMNGIKTSLSDILDISEEFISNDFVKDHMDKIREAAEGDEKAIDDLKKALADQIILDMFEVDSLDQLSIDLQSKITTLKDWIDKNPLKIGATIDTANMNADEAAFLKSCQEVITAAGMTAEQANAYFSQMGYSTEFETAPQPVKRIGYETITQSEVKENHTVRTPDGNEITYPGVTVTKTYQGNPYELTEWVDAIKMQTVTVDGKETQVPEIKSISKTPTGSSNNFSSSNVGGSSTKKAKPIKRTKKTNVVERYKEVIDKIDDVQNAMNDASKAADRLWGPARLKQLEKQNELIQDEVKLLKQKKKEAQANLIKDRSDLSKAAATAGVSFNIDEKGNITNYTEKMNALYAELESRENEANGFAKVGKSKEQQDEYIEKYVTPLQDKINELKEAMSQYDETRELLEDIDDQVDDKWNEWQDNNYEQLTYKLELNLELNDMELEDIEYELNKIADDFYKMAEAAALMVDSSASTEGISQLDIYSAKLEAYEEQRMALDKAFFENEEISQAAYVEGMKEIKSGIYENLEAIQELDKSMMDYYGNTLDMAAAEIAKYTDRMDHQVSVLDHYSSLLEIMGKQNDYKTMHKTLEAKAQIIGDQVAVAKDTLEMYQGQAEARFNEYQDALARGDEKAAELYLKQYEAALAAANEAQDVYLSKAEEWAEALKAVLENKLADIGKTLEEALTGGTSFDEISKQMERASSLQEEYLTTTNKIYETNKMINTAQQAIDKTDNLNAKRRLRSFQEETAQMQNKGKLSKFELEIQQAKYDLLLAEIALEEAQNAKSMVRLQRDSEGNFGYVYTADDQKVAEAEQNAMDKENALYNIRLEGANSYVEKYQQTMQEMYDELQDLTDRYHNGEIESFEEYQRLMTETQNHYYQKLEDYSELYGIAIQEDTRIIEDAWSTEFASMTENTEEWKKNVDIYIGEVSTAFDNYEKEMERIALETGTDMASMENSIKEVVDESKNLKDALVGENGLISAINDQATAVANITSHYASLRDSLGLITAAYEASGKAASDAIIKQQKALQAINTTNTALKNQSGTAGTNGSLVKDEGKDEEKNPEPPPVEPPSDEPPTDEQDITVTVYASNTRTTPKHTLTINKDSKFTVSGNAIASQEKLPYGSPQEYFYSISHPQSGHIGYINQVAYSTLKNTFPTKFDTGGYTGQWGTEGKLAMLHQKELVLNADDTQNFLTSLDVLHEIIKMIDLQAINSRVGGFLQIPNMNFAPNEILDQQVHIEASFPGVTDRNEIEEAFKTLVNRASQFANRKNF